MPGNLDDRLTGRPLLNKFSDNIQLSQDISQAVNAKFAIKVRPLSETLNLFTGHQVASIIPSANPPASRQLSAIQLNLDPTRRISLANWRLFSLLPFNRLD